VWVGGDGAISSYTIGSTGALTLAASQAGAATANFVSLETSPDGQWLFALDSITFTVYVFKINTSTGSLTVNQALVYSPPGSGTAAAPWVAL
jgi:6-phosphogluconolactonase (cycloisomerase 2 family)